MGEKERARRERQESGEGDEVVEEKEEVEARRRRKEQRRRQWPGRAASRVRLTCGAAGHSSTRPPALSAEEVPLRPGTSGGEAGQAPVCRHRPPPSALRPAPAAVPATLQTGDLPGTLDAEFCLSGQVSLCSPGYPGAGCEDQAGLELSGPLQPLSLELTPAAFTDHWFLRWADLSSDTEQWCHPHVFSLPFIHLGGRD